MQQSVRFVATWGGAKFPKRIAICCSPRKNLAACRSLSSPEIVGGTTCAKNRGLTFMWAPVVTRGVEHTLRFIEPSLLCKSSFFYFYVNVPHIFYFYINAPHIFYFYFYVLPLLLRLRPGAAANFKKGTCTPNRPKHLRMRGGWVPPVRPTAGWLLVNC